MTLNEFTTEIASRYGKQLDLQYRQWLVPQINHWRSKLIRNTLRKTPNEKSQFLQHILIPLSYGNYTCTDFNCTGSYSEKLPTLLRVGDTPFEFLGSVDKSSPYRYVDTGTQMYINAGKTAHLFHQYLFINQRIIIPDKKIHEVSGSGIFDEPQVAMNWQCQTENNGCDWWNSPYPVTGDIANDIKTALWDSLGNPEEIQPQKQNQDE